LVSLQGTKVAIFKNPNLKILNVQKRIFNLQTSEQFNALALEIFHFQYQQNSLYRQWVDCLNLKPSEVKEVDQIPFLPIELWKNHRIQCGSKPAEVVFKSSGTGNGQRSTHYVTEARLYEQSFQKGFAHFYGDISDYHLLALLPSYLEQGESSLVYMAQQLMQKAQRGSGFYLNNPSELAQKLQQLKEQGAKVMLLGVSYALLDFVEQFPLSFPSLTVIETGGMKGRRKELLRAELHSILKQGFDVPAIHSEYGMTELLSQAYSQGGELFRCPPWMQIKIRETNDPLAWALPERTGGINVIDLANVNSCSFIATQDLGKLHPDGSFEVLGRFDQAEMRGCNLMVG
jgi:phenylacetate-coenzyme A ligase PaaK-like adenylate-forming protein